jgi:hypothetical protein
MTDFPSDGVYLRRNFLSPFVLLKVMGVLDRLSGSWTPSQALGLLGRGHTSQIRPTDIMVQGLLDEIGHAIAPAALQWARACGFRFQAAPQVQLFPVRMVGDAETPAYQDPHVDSYASQPNPPISTNVFYVRTQDVSGGELVVAKAGSDLSDPIVVQPTPNTIVSFPGDRVHSVRPLYAGERLSVVINFY